MKFSFSGLSVFCVIIAALTSMSNAVSMQYPKALRDIRRREVSNHQDHLSRRSYVLLNGKCGPGYGICYPGLECRGGKCLHPRTPPPSPPSISVVPPTP
ncbi:hypothetical protein FISHEDRAFT_75568 [Fistulina hepatica ATCC 64428]|uniref:CBM1 domain-containing protein n=1 Tax=Fistulina hepatica ATCC 64428 TaxID=1128425 RepID=A0A0D7A6A3_9AGAR|nr:hypothetical protein FISHEDRAFT_75568 [Fistulina hepatica ATCC 64428]